MSTSAVLLDTNVLSELMRLQPAPQVLAWFDARQREGTRLLTSCITQAEILLGIALLPAGRRRDLLAQAAQGLFDEDFGADTCLPFDTDAATDYALLVAARTAQGRPISTEDGQIAAIALSCGLPLATRNVRDFAGIGRLSVLDPFVG
jgi:hypothetical protein